MQLPGLENCLHELLLERARHLTAMESLTSQLRRREAEATKHDHDVKALAARLECTEQDKSALERRARAAAEEHRVERARWFVHKQVCVRHVVCFGRDAADLRSFFENETGGAGGGVRARNLCESSCRMMEAREVVYSDPCGRGR